MKLSINTVLLIAILALAAWYMFFRKHETVTIPADPSTGTPEKTVTITTPAQPTIIEKIVEVVKWRDRVRVNSNVAKQKAAGNPVIESFSPNTNFWKRRY